MAVNKVIYDGTTLVDLTDNTVTADTMLAGVTATDRSGEQITGNVVDSGHAWQDSDGYIHLDDDVGTKTDVSDTTATPSTVLDGEIFYTSAGVRSVGTVTVPTVNNATLTIQKNGTTVKTFTANASSNVTANITVPTAVSDLTNDSGYITASDNFTGATASADGADGTVPAPSTASAGDLTRTFLSAMGEWRRLSATFGTDATSATLSIRSYTEDGSSSSLLTTTLSAVSANTAGVMTATDKTNLDNGYIQFDATATSGDDYDLATALTALGWLSDVIV